MAGKKKRRNAEACVSRFVDEIIHCLSDNIKCFNEHPTRKIYLFIRKHARVLCKAIVGGNCERYTTCHFSHKHQTQFNIRPVFASKVFARERESRSPGSR